MMAKNGVVSWWYRVVHFFRLARWALCALSSQSASRGAKQFGEVRNSAGLGWPGGSRSDDRL